MLFNRPTRGYGFVVLTLFLFPLFPLHRGFSLVNDKIQYTIIVRTFYKISTVLFRTLNG